jgi:regulator of sirC expression with transglutaminase-like and TPR domain
MPARKQGRDAQGRDKIRARRCSVACDEKRQLAHEVDLKAHNLQASLKQEEDIDPKWELGEIRRMAQDLIDSIEELRKHEDEHKCNA